MQGTLITHAGIINLNEVEVFEIEYDRIDHPWRTMKESYNSHTAIGVLVYKLVAVFKNVYKDQIPRRESLAYLGFYPTDNDNVLPEQADYATILQRAYAFSKQVASETAKNGYSDVTHWPHLMNGIMRSKMVKMSPMVSDVDPKPEE